MPKHPRRWSTEEDAALRDQVESQRAANKGEIKDWSTVANMIPQRSNKDCRKRYYNEVAGGLKKGAWTKDEDALLTSYVSQFGQSWSVISQKMKNRSADQCSKRWTHCLDPNVDHSEWTEEETISLLIAARKHGTSWKSIQKIHMPGRSANTLKNQFNLALRRRIQIPQDAEPCCPEGGSASSNLDRGYSPIGCEDITDVSSLLDNRGDIDFSEFTSFDMASPFLQDLGNLEVNDLGARMPNHDALSSQQTPFSLHDSPENDPKVTTDEGQFSSPSYDTSGYQDTSTELETDAQNRLCLPCPPTTTQTNDTIDSVFLTEQHPSTATWAQTLLGSYKPEDGNPMGLLGVTGLACPGDGGSAGNRTTITLDNIEPENLFAVMNILFRSKASVKLEVQQ